VSGQSLTVAVLSGGRSSEHDVSLASGASIRAGLVEAGHEVLSIEVGRDGVWRRDARAISISPGAGLLGVDVVFGALHGPFGEDGVLQGLLESLDVAYVGADVAASALCMDKVLFKELMGARGVPQVDFVGVRSARFHSSRGGVRAELARLGLPVFVKPAHLGSSVGIAKAGTEAELDAGLALAFAHDDLVIVEAMATGVEVECGVIGVLASAREQGAPAAQASVPGQIELDTDWYDYRAKYLPGGMTLKLPADISDAAVEAVRSLALEAFAITGCEGLARVDFFVDGDVVLLNELNTMPGFTPTSVYAKLLDASGVSYPALVDRLCRLAIERREHRAAFRY
jgi:D-alanine-D-alanine ligase